MGDELTWPIEEIPDSDSVFMRAHRGHFRNGELQPGVFRAHGSGMSVNWAKYSSAEETRQQATKKPEDNAVISILVAGIRKIGVLRVEHSPEPSNRAHSDVLGLENREHLTEARILLLRIKTIVIPLPPK